LLGAEGVGCVAGVVVTGGVINPALSATVRLKNNTVSVQVRRFKVVSALLVLENSCARPSPLGLCNRIRSISTAEITAQAILNQVYMSKALKLISKDYL
jgi:hypothetical protein